MPGARVLRMVIALAVLSFTLLQLVAPVVAAAAFSAAGGGDSRLPQLAQLLGKIDRKLLDEKYMSRYFVRAAKLMGLGSPAEAASQGVKLLVQINGDYERGVAQLSKVAGKYGAELCGGIPALNVAVVCGVPASNRFTYMKALLDIARLGSVEKVWLNDIANLTMFDTRILIDFAPVQERLGINGSGIKVAVLDTGFDDSHPELEGALYAWADFINNETEPYDDHGHGTFVSSVIAARGNVNWMYGNGMWHAILYADAPEFNSPGPANLTYEINVTSYAGGNLTVELAQRLCIAPNNYAAILYRFDTNTTWTVVANYTDTIDGMLSCDPTAAPPETEAFNVTVPANATRLYISFIYEPYGYDPYGTGGLYLITYQGWFLDNITVYNASNPGDVLFSDDVEGPAPAELINSTRWVRTSTRLLGVAPGAMIMAGKVCAPDGCPYDAILNGIAWATLGPDGEPNTGDEADIISMSLGGPATEYDIIAQAVDWAAYEYGKIVVIAAGNEGPGYYTVASPGIAHGAITVGASTKTNTLAFFSSWGPSPVDYTVKPDVLAPGRLVVGAYSSDAAGAPAGSYLTAVWDGTSFSTPHISGVVALLKQAHPDWGLEDIRAALVSTAVMPQPSNIPGYATYPVDAFTSGGGIVDVYRAINATLLPEPAVLSIGVVMAGDNGTVQRIVFLKNTASSNITVEVVSAKLYHVDTATGVSTDVSSWIASPSAGETYTVPANGNTTMNLTITVPVTADSGPYWGVIEFNVSGELYHMILGMYVAAPIKVSGYVYDISTGAPVAGATVAAVTPDLASVLASNTTDETGYYELYVPSGVDFRLAASADGYYQFISPILNSDVDMSYDIVATPAYGPAPRQLLVVKDTKYGYWSEYVVAPEILLALNGSMGVTMRLWNNTIQGLAAPAILSGDYVAVAWMAGGQYYPVDDPLDMAALVTFASINDTGVMLSGGDIGWWHDGDELMTNVAHAVYVDDMWPGAYTIELNATGHPLTTGLPASIDIDSSLDLPGAYGWPDAVLPTNGGYTVGYWLDNGYAAIVAYNGFENGGSDTVYLAFPLNSILDDTVKTQLLRNVVAWIIDHEPPMPAPAMQVNTSVTYVNSSTALVNVTWTPFNDMTAVSRYRVYVNGSMAAESSTTSATVAVEPGYTYEITIEAVDYKGYSAAASPVPLYVPPYGTQGGSVYQSSPGNYSGVFPNTTIQYNMTTTGPAAAQAVVLQVDANASSFASSQRKVVVGYLDVKVFGAENITVLTIAIPYEESNRIQEDTIELYWYNITGGEWLPVSNFTVDTANNVIYVTFTNTTSPSLADLSGTPILILANPALVGGGYTFTASLAQLAAALAAAAALLVVLMRRRQ